jgi:hypothetical protein
MRMRTIATLLLLPLLVSLACARGEQAQQEETGMEESGDEMAAGSEMTMGGTVTLDLATLNNSGITGTAEITHGEDAVTVVLNMSGLTAGESYAAHVHQGTCEQQGSVVAPLNPVVGGTDGSGTSTTEIANSDLEGMMGEESPMGEEGEMGMEGEHPEGDFFVQVHSPDGTRAACANLERPSEEMM